MKADLNKEIILPEGVTVRKDQTGTLHIKGPKGEISRQFLHPRVNLEVAGKKIIATSKAATLREKKNLSTFVAHIKNMVEGVQNPYIYKLKICSGHFPINVTVSGEEIIVKNFLGEAKPRRTNFAKGVIVKVNGTEIVVESPDVELAGQTAAKIEILCRIRGRDLRIFQDGCYITKKPGDRQ